MVGQPGTLAGMPVHTQARPCTEYNTGGGICGQVSSKQGFNVSYT
jgi:hypothetical protein